MKPTPLRAREQDAVAAPRCYEVCKFTGHLPENVERHEFPYSLDGLTQARAHQASLPRSILFLVGMNEVRVPYAQVEENKSKPGRPK